MDSNPEKNPCVLTIAGSDSSGGAGIQADIKTATMFGTYAMTAVTAITVQNTLGVQDVLPLEPALIVAQMRAVLDDIGNLEGVERTNSAVVLETRFRR